MKKIAIFILIISLLLAALTGCAAQPDSGGIPDQSEPITTAAEVPETTEPPETIEPPTPEDSSYKTIETIEVKKIDLSLPENQSYKDTIGDYFIEPDGQMTQHPLGQNFILQEGESLWLSDGDAKEKRLLLEGIPHQDGVPVENAKGYYFVKSIDENRFIYKCAGYEWSNGCGIYDVTTEQNHPFENDDTNFDYLGINGNLVYCVPANQNRAHWIDNLDILEVNSDDYSTRLQEISLRPLKIAYQYFHEYKISPDCKTFAVSSYSNDENGIRIASVDFYDVSDGRVIDNCSFEPENEYWSPELHYASNDTVYAFSNSSDELYEITLL